MNIRFWTRKPQYSVASQRGPRAENQDNYLIRAPNGICQMLRNEQAVSDKIRCKTAGRWRFAVLDGMGGHACGREISERAAVLLAHSATATEPQALKDLLLELHDTLYQEFHFINSQTSPGTTLAIVELDIKRRSALIGHIGDSRIYTRETHGTWQQQTQDHITATFIQREHKPQQIALAQDNPPLAQALGFGSMGVFIKDGALIKKYDKNIRLDLNNPHTEDNDVRVLELPPHSHILLASDGIWHTSSHCVRPFPTEATDAMDFIKHSKKSGALDNMTAVMVGI